MRTLFVGIALLMGACRPQPEHRDGSNVAARQASATTVSAPSPAAMVPSAAVAGSDAASALARYLAYASFRGAPAGAADVGACPPFDASGDDVDEGWEPDNYVGLVLPRVLGASLNPADTTGASATGRAEVMRVAEIQRDSLGWAGRLERRLDTLTFTLQRGATGWAVCGPATRARVDSLSGEPLFVITYESAQRTEVNGARWLPAGTTWHSVASHADSVLKAGHQLPRQLTP